MPPGIIGLGSLAAGLTTQTNNTTMTLNQLQGLSTQLSGINQVIPGTFTFTNNTSFQNNSMTFPGKDGSSVTMNTPDQNSAQHYAILISSAPDKDGKVRKLFAITTDGKIEVDPTVEADEVAMEVLDKIAHILKIYCGNAFDLLKK